MHYFWAFPTKWFELGKVVWVTKRDGLVLFFYVLPSPLPSPKYLPHGTLWGHTDLTVYVISHFAWTLQIRNRVRIKTFLYRVFPLLIVTSTPKHEYKWNIIRTGIHSTYTILVCTYDVHTWLCRNRNPLIVFQDEHDCLTLEYPIAFKMHVNFN